MYHDVCTQLVTTKQPPPADTNTTRHTHTYIHTYIYISSSTPRPPTTVPRAPHTSCTPYLSPSHLISSHLMSPTPDHRSKRVPTLVLSMPGHNATERTHRRCSLPCLREGYPCQIVGMRSPGWAWICGFFFVSRWGQGGSAGFFKGRC